ncbi:MAG: DUF4880 domain-containing protein, partial [Comamonadaceae bacterium]
MHSSSAHPINRADPASAAVHPCAKDTAQTELGADGGDGEAEALIELQACTWAVRCRDGLNADGQARLQAWLDAHPHHAAALDAVSDTLHSVQHLPADQAARLRAGLPERLASHRAEVSPSFWRRWLWPVAPHAAMAVVALSLGGAGWFGWWVQPTFEQSYASQRGQQLLATLPDDAAAGSTIQLDTATRLQAKLFRDRREVALSEGQAMFAVHPDKDRPFHVTTGDLRITVLGTRFSVRHTASGIDAGHTVVAVEEGRVRVERLTRDTHKASAKGAGVQATVELNAGQMLAAPGGQDAGSSVGTVTGIAPAAVAQWRGGRISFDQTPLIEALAEFERYGATGLLVTDPA